MARTTALALASAAAMAALLSACGNGPPSSSETGGSAGGGGGATTQGASLGTADVKVSAGDDLKFTPASTSAKVGQIVEWDNSGSAQHNITFTTASASDATDTSFAAGDKWQVKFTKAGTYDYQCTLHPGMDGKISVS
jgi:plastocyanin